MTQTITELRTQNYNNTDPVQTTRFDSNNWIEAEGFTKAGRFTVENDKPVYKLEEGFVKNKLGMVYVWVSGNEILYVGLASKGIDARYKQHEASWHGKHLSQGTTGYEKGKKIKAEIEAAGDIVVYAITTEEYKEIEAMMILDLQPAWNIQGLNKKVRLARKAELEKRC